ncbi:MAG: hypothetical protein COV74_10410 [Candidatus Omnitrophica bacterium CG11_big_fil_rev_8_21_14_0_20_45_26]|uniref:Response regulatory domain-containing protein n=1 Tax=Candidatus Abzuiibacterium crystallinum TaxID=1974748 RepID=A0A2H0LKS7_9BACT|nr:MAG: hypothetical protein COV74_10410 [Candidatus Omnitrophica bacterium CG11_big_fil_rev_8_21_14_0_20_45_26]PIW63920.1 MAG: hypothetical protein COW12_08410 [Candidatus Omnitrophica bacterium CG12_big_fil_rev_8_21_14_0_65_45_16]
MPTLLIVDDESEICEFLKEFFKSDTQFNILTATDPDAAIEILKNVKPEGVLLDVKLKARKTGLDVLQAIRDISPNTKTIMVTSHTDYHTVERARVLGAVGYVTKPFSLEYLESTVHTRVASLFT